MDPRGRRILIVGDSLSAGASTPGGVLAAELRRRGAADVRIDARVSRSAVNLWNGTNGETGASIVAEAARRPEVVVVFLGTNDAATGVGQAKDEAGFRRIVAAFAPGTEFWTIGAPAFPARPAIAARVPAVYQTQVRVFGAGRVLDARPLTPATGRADDGVHFKADGAAVFGRALADALTPAGAPAAASGSAIPAPSRRAWGWTVGGVVVAAAAVGVAAVIRRRRHLAGAGPEDTALAPGIPATLRTAQRALERMGWELVNVEIDQVKGTARVEVKRDDGRYVTLDTRNGRTTITREQSEVQAHRVGRRGDSAIVDRMHMRFLGRDRVEGGMRAGLKALAHYLDDNTTGPRLGREALAKLLHAPASPTGDDRLGAARDRVIGTDYPAEVVHGTTKKSAQAFLQRRDLPERERTRTLSEFGSGVLYVAEKTAPHQAVMFGTQGGRTMLALQLAPGRRVLDVASEMQRRPFVGDGGPIAFKGRPSITDDMGRWLVERRTARGLRPVDVAIVDPTSSQFASGDYPNLLVTYARDRGYAAVRFTDETVVVDPTAVIGARRLKPAEVAALRTARRRLPAIGPMSLYTRDFEDDNEPLAGRRREQIPGGLAPGGACPPGTDPRELRRGITVEREHTSDPAVAHEIACDHLTEDPRYYTKLATIEAR